MGRSDIWAILKNVDYSDLSKKRHDDVSFRRFERGQSRHHMWSSARAGRVRVALSATSPQTQHGKEGRYQEPYELP